MLARSYLWRMRSVSYTHLIQVPDTRLAYKALAAWYRAQFHIPFVQITGSVGKTTTKEMIAAVLSEHEKVLWTEGNFNNDIGVPKTLLRLSPEHRAAVIETGIDVYKRQAVRFLFRCGKDTSYCFTPEFLPCLRGCFCLSYHKRAAVYRRFAYFAFYGIIPPH